MDDRFSTPRVNAPHLPSNIGRRVMLIGRVVQLRGSTAVLDAAGTVTLQLNRDAHLVAGHIAQVIGKVLPDQAVQVLSASDLGPDVDLDLADMVVQLTHELKPVFIFD